MKPIKSIKKWIRRQRQWLSLNDFAKLPNDIRVFNFYLYRAGIEAHELWRREWRTKGKRRLVETYREGARTLHEWGVTDDDEYEKMLWRVEWLKKFTRYNIGILTWFFTHKHKS